MSKKSNTTGSARNIPKRVFSAAPSCAEAGVLGVLPGVIGVLQAVETIKILLGVGRTLAGRLVTYEALGTHFNELRLKRDLNCKYCTSSTDDFPGKVKYFALADV